MRETTKDIDLVRSCKRGDNRAFEELIGRYQKQLFNVALRMVGDYDDARDVTQCAFVKAYEKLDTFNEEYKFFSWIYRIMVNESLNLINRRRPREPLDTRMPVTSATPDEQLMAKELTENVQDALMDLSLNSRMVVVLRHFASLSHREIGFILEISEKKVKSRLFSARQRLGSILIQKGVVTHD